MIAKFNCVIFKDELGLAYNMQNDGNKK